MSTRFGTGNIKGIEVTNVLADAAVIKKNTFQKITLSITSSPSPPKKHLVCDCYVL